MKTISILLHSRPELLEPTMTALLRAQNLDWFDLVLFCVDVGHPKSAECAESARACAKLLTETGVIDASVFVQDRNQGIEAHSGLALHAAFEWAGSDFNVYLEDDALVKPDTLRLFLWWEQFGPALFKDCCLIAGSNHTHFGRGTQRLIPEDDPKIVVESLHIPSPFCWATTKAWWPFFKKWWCFKQEPPNGFDWSLSMAMRLNKLVAMHPALSRCQNIGREGGAHETGETFDQTQLGLHYQEEPYEGIYELMGRMDRALLERLDPWMVSEMRRLRGDDPTVLWKSL